MQKSKTERRVVLTEDNQLEIREYPLPAMRPDQVLIESACSLISAGTELGIQGAYAEYSAAWKHDEPTVQHARWIGGVAQRVERSLGYSNVGHIVAVGGEVEKNDNLPFKIGDMVLSSGNHSSHVIVTPGSDHLTPVPAGLSCEEAAFGVLGSVSLYGIERAGLRLGDHVAIIGMGVVGQLAVQLAIRTGCESVTAIDLESSRLEIAQRAGATHIVDVSTEDLNARVRDITHGDGIHTVIEASGASSAIPEAIDIARTGGTILLLGTPWRRNVEADLFLVHLKELAIVGCHQPLCPKVETPAFPWTQSSNRRQILRMIEDGRLNVKQLVTHRKSFLEIEEAYRLLKDEKDKSLAVVLEWN